MKKNILFSTAFAIGLSFTPHLAKAGGDYLSKFIDAISNSTAASKICRKANAFGGTFSIRSFDGMACSVPLIAAFAETICPQNSDDYGTSKCHTISQNTLKGQDPKEALVNEIKKMTKGAKGTFCGKAGQVSSALATACSKSDSVSGAGGSEPKGGESSKKD